MIVFNSRCHKHGDNKKNLNKTILLITSFIVVFSLWFFTDIPLGKKKSTVVSTSNFIDVYFFTGSDFLWRNSLKLIEKNIYINNISFYRTYIDLIKVTQWYDPLYIYQKKAFLNLAEIYIKKNRWGDLFKLSNNQIKIDPRDANSYYLAGLSQYKLENVEKSESYYYQALSVDSTNINTIKGISDILIEQGRYFDLKKILNHYINVLSSKNDQICFYWGDENFSENYKICNKIFLEFNEEINSKIDVIPKNKESLERISLFRIDPPMGVFKINSVTVKLKSGSVIVVDHSDWALSKDIIKIDENSYKSKGFDPYLSVQLSNPILMNDLSSINVDFNYKNYDFINDPKILFLLELVNDKT